MPKDIKDKVKRQLAARYSDLFSEEFNEARIREVILEVIADVAFEERITVTQPEAKKLADEFISELVGFGPIEGLMEDPSVTEIMINGPKKVYAETNGETRLTGITFDDDTQLMNLIYRVLSPTRRRVDESSPFTEISLKDGSRANIIIPPLALDGPTLTIRKFLREIRTAEDLIKLGSLDKRMADFLVACIKGKANIIFSGATGSGKTSTLNVLSSYIPNKERIVTIEDTAELRLMQDHVVRLETRQIGIEGKGEVSIRDLFKNSLRMRPDRIILGEIRGSEALDMLQAICSGHGGSLSVIHASTPLDLIYRIETMILTSGLPFSIEAIHRQMASAINIIVQQEQLSDGSRKITYITQINGLKDGRVVLEDIFVYDIEGLSPEGKVLGRWRATGGVPNFYPQLKKMGVDLPKEIFNKD